MWLVEEPWLSLRVQTPRAADQDEITYALARRVLKHCPPIARGFRRLAGQSLAGR